MTTMHRDPFDAASPPDDELPARPDVSMDPATPAEWEALRALGHRMLDDMVEHLRTARERPAWRPIPAEVKAALRGPLPVEGQDAARIYEDFREQVLPYPVGNMHPRFWGWVLGSGTPVGMLAELLTGAINVSGWGSEQAAPYVELQVLDWCKEMLGYPAEASGILVSGGTVANFVGLAAARDAHGGGDVGQTGLHASPAQLTVYCSEQTHNSVHKAVGLLGIGRDGLREIPTDAAYRIDVAALAAAIAEDRAAGRRPVCVVGNAGTVNTGAIDDLEALAELCARERIWLHIDGAFGAFAALSPALRPLVRGMERADSVAFDMHKWLHMPYDVGCILVRDREAHQRPFSPQAHYLASLERGPAAGPWPTSNHGLDLSRANRALRVWMTFRAYGIGAYARQIEQNVSQARYLAERIRAHPELELLAPVPLNVVCFRYVPPAARDGGHVDLDALNRELLMRIQERGIAVPSNTVLRGRFALRAAITNHRSRREDFDLLIESAVAIGREVVGGE